MTVITITREAKCKDCKYCIGYQKGKLKRHFCDKMTSPRHGQDVRLNDLVCNGWNL